ncbi:MULTISPECIES: ABC transporter ATP-binding protein [unclassified Brevibacterium]|uniref:ABC transporter ATP-binding protein n=1 Tax=unclassified Brevibacterium TaxID=2614124 RepID=UPI00197AF752|nr:ABC transporter ATP-binding protein [Brevibacterium sp. S22]
MNTSATHTDAHPSPNPAPRLAIQAIGLYKTYGKGDAQVRPLDDLSLDIEAERFTAIMGPSGSGKSTLLNMLAGLDTPDSGEVFIGRTAISRLGDRKLTALRRDRIGFVFQSFNLVPAMSAEENILLPLQLSGQKTDGRIFDRMVDLLGLRERLGHRPHELSGGQQQRVAVARALVAQPDVLVADEPTGNLDSNSGEEVLNILRASVDELGQTVVMVTHDPRAASRADRVVLLADGRLAGELAHPDPESVSTALMNVTASTARPAAASAPAAAHAPTDGGAR